VAASGQKQIRPFHQQGRRAGRSKLQFPLGGKEMFSRRLFLSLILVAMPASADLLQVAISGQCDDTVPTTELTAPNSTWVSTVDVDSQAMAIGGVAAVDHESNLTYVLNNNPVSGIKCAASQTIFFDTAEGGGLSTATSNSDGSAPFGFDFVGSQQLFSGVSNPEILTGSFDTAVGPDLELNGDDSKPLQTASILITDLSIVPEPYSNLLQGPCWPLRNRVLVQAAPGISSASRPITRLAI
jgi:hypothetical protein